MFSNQLLFPRARPELLLPTSPSSKTSLTPSPFQTTNIQHGCGLYWKIIARRTRRRRMLFTWPKRGNQDLTCKRRRRSWRTCELYIWIVPLNGGLIDDNWQKSTKHQGCQLLEVNGIESSLHEAGGDDMYHLVPACASAPTWSEVLKGSHTCLVPVVVDEHVLQQAAQLRRGFHCNQIRDSRLPQNTYT